MKKIGILGGGQLGKMFLENSYKYPFQFYFLDPNPQASCASMTHNFQIGDFRNYDTVMLFGQDKDVIGIEIEDVNTQALKDLKIQGKTIIPDPEVLEIIQDKGLQKQLFINNQIPTAPFQLIEKASDFSTKLQFPFYQKFRKGGYDGKGVIKINNINDLQNCASVIEAEADLLLEISVIVAKDKEGNTACYDVVEFVADDKLNLVDYLIMPSNLSSSIQEQAKNIALQLVKLFKGAGLFAIEMFVNKDLSIWVNEVAPRVHNSGHSTIEACDISQFDQMTRLLAGLPLGSTKCRALSAMLNIVSPENLNGNCKLSGIEKILELDKVYLHWYGKTEARPGRKMGHITFLGSNKEELIKKINFTKSVLNIEKA